MLKRSHIILVVALAFVASLTPCVHAQTYDKSYAKALILPGGGTDAIHNLTITLNSSTNTGITWTLPATNINGLFSNDGAGNISWATTLPSGLTIPSPIFTGTISFTAGSIPVADLASNTTALTSSGNTLTFSGGNGSGAVALGGTAGNYDINLAHANTWTGQQNFTRTADSIAPATFSNTAATAKIQYGAAIASTGSSTGLGNVGLLLNASGSTGYNAALYVQTGTVNVQGLNTSQVVMTDASRNLISAGSSSTVPVNTFLAGASTGSGTGAATFRALNINDFSAGLLTSLGSSIAASTGNQGVPSSGFATANGTLNISTTTPTYASTGLSFTVPASATYAFTFEVYARDSVQNGGGNGVEIELVPVGTNNVSSISYGMFGTGEGGIAGAIHWWGQHYSALSTPSVNNFITTKQEDGEIRVAGIVVNGSGGSTTLQLQFANGSTGGPANVSFIYGGSFVTAGPVQ